MDQEREPASVPLPVSAAPTPFSSPPSRPQNWLQGSLHSSPTPASPAELSRIEVVPPSPPRRPRKHTRKATPEQDITVPPSPVIPGTPRSGRRARMMVDRMSKSFHAGTPPPAMRMLHPDDARNSPISHTFLRDGKRSSVVSNLLSSRRQSVVSVHMRAPTPWEPRQHDRDSRHLEDYPQEGEGGGGGGVEEGEAGGQRGGNEGREPTRSHSISSQRRPHIEHRETTSDETYVNRETPTDGSPSPRADGAQWRSPTRVDPLTALERRRRRDYTLGSHHPLRAPPNTPVSTPRGGVGASRRLSGGSDVVREDDGETLSVEWRDIVHRFKSLWRRFGDMPWVADPCVATLVIPQNTKTSAQQGQAAGGDGGAKVGEEEEVVAPWYRPKPTLDELLEEGQAEVKGEADDGSETLAHYGSNSQSPGGKQPQWIPRKPPPTHHAGRDLFGDNLVIRGVVNQ